MQSSLSVLLLCSLAVMVLAQEITDDELSADKRVRSFAFAKRSPYRTFAFAKRSADPEDEEGMTEEKRARFAFAKRSPYRQFAFAKRGPYGFAFAKRASFA